MNYFAYGSNMLSRRLRARVGEIRIHGVGWITGHQLRFHKVSVDGSGKCDIHETGSPAHVVHGVVFEINARQKRRLDRFEGLGRGYEETFLPISLRQGPVVTAVAYRATSCNGQLLPYHWYHALVLAGAREHRLPGPYLKEIERIPACHDPDPERARTHLRLLGTLH